MRKVEKLTNKLVSNGIFNQAQFVFYSACGAEGNPGTIIIVTDNGIIYEGNYVYGNLSIEKIIKEFPYIGENGMSLFENGKSKDNEIRYFYLESGNYLFMRENVYEFFVDLNGSNQYVEQPWLELAERICPDIERLDKLNAIKAYCQEIGMKIPDVYPFGTDEELDSFLETWDEYEPFPELK
ncbi:MAG: hypothetical protein ACI4J7_05195 [Ruminiclostridium sp.]